MNGGRGVHPRRSFPLGLEGSPLSRGIGRRRTQPLGYPQENLGIYLELYTTGITIDNPRVTLMYILRLLRRNQPRRFNPRVEIFGLRNPENHIVGSSPPPPPPGWRRDLNLDARQEGRRQSDADFHSFRRWFATKAEQAGQPPHTISAVLGHEEGRGGMTLGVYSAGPSLEQRRAVVEAVRLPPGCRL